MLNLYSKQQIESSQQITDIVQLVEAPCTNSEGKCNFCGGKIYWNPSVRNRKTKKKLPLQEPYLGHGTSPIPHRGCKYNLQNFYKSLVILESDSPYVKRKKMEQQDKLRILPNYTRYEVPKSWYAYTFKSGK